MREFNKEKLGIVYKKNSKGAILYRKVVILEMDSHSTVYTTTGKCESSLVSLDEEANGKTTIKKVVAVKGKGHFERAHEQQVRDREKRLRLGYFDNYADAVTKEPAKVAMLVKDMSIKEIDDIPSTDFPMYQQVKLNGIRGTYHLSTNQVLSRELNPFNLIEITAQCQVVCKSLGFDYLDFELYAEGHPINEIVSMVRHDDPKIKAYIFDVPSDKRQEDRVEDCGKVLDLCKREDIARIEVLSFYPVYDKETVKTFFHKVISEDQEGIILRKPSALYGWNNKTSRDDRIRKVKPILSAEFKIVGIEWDERIHEGKTLRLVEFVCEVKEGVYFKVTPTTWGMDLRHDWHYEHVGKQRMKAPGAADLLPLLSVEFREYTKTMKPFHILDCYLRPDITR